MSDQLLDAIEHAARLARLERREQRHRDLVAEVARYVSENPTASANAVAAAVGGRRSEVLRLVRELRRAPRPVPSGGEPRKEGEC